MIFLGFAGVLLVILGGFLFFFFFGGGGESRVSRVVHFLCRKHGKPYKITRKSPDPSPVKPLP